jgi:DNA-damage-inducible protein D
MADLEVLPFDASGNNFESRGNENGFTFWYARDLMAMLGYDVFDTFERAINKAIRACSTLNIPLVDSIQPIQRHIDGAVERDYKLSRFGCYLVAINGDVRKPQVAAAQAYFVTLAESFRRYLQQTENVDRLLIRDDITVHDRSLASVASQAGVENFAFFQSSGYRGLYNMTLAQLRDHRGIDKTRSPLDFMGGEELAANLFRITQTEAKIKNEGTRGQRALEEAARTVGAKVRKTMLELSGTPPERLPAVEDIKTVKKGLKQAHRQFEQFGVARRKKLPPASDPPK